MNIIIINGPVNIKNIVLGNATESRHTVKGNNNHALQSNSITTRETWDTQELYKNSITSTSTAWGYFFGLGIKILTQYPFIDNVLKLIQLTSVFLINNKSPPSI